MRRHPRPPLLAAVALTMIVAGCTAEVGSAPPDLAEAAAGDAAAADDSADEGRAIELTGEMSLEPSSGPAGTAVTATGRDLPPATTLDVVWTEAECDWVLEGEQDEEYHGRDCQLVEQPMGTVTTGPDGDLEASFTVPVGHGFAHDVLLIDGDGVVRNRAGFNVDMQVAVTPSSGPVGTPITIEVEGMGWQSLEDTRTILYDNRYVGFMSAVTTDGVATAVIPATGAPGTHFIEVNRGAYTFPYLNPDQSPRPDIPTFSATFTVTDGPPVLPQPIDEQNPAAVRAAAAAAADGPSIAADLTAGPVGTEFTLDGSGFEPGATVDLQWFRIVGNRVAGQGWDEQSVPLATVTADDAGTFTHTTEVPGDVGGPHRVEAAVAGTVLAETSVTVVPHADPLAATEVARGDEVVLHLTGVGWTETANIYTVVYDNAYMGYACGFNTQGDVVVTLTAAGEPGWHFVELYPAIYKGEEPPGRNNFRIPQLTALDDHPGEDLPVFRHAFRITEDGG